jgi:uncharacterized protein
MLRFVELSALYVYPIKSCAGLSLPEARVVERGLELDRRYMLIDSSGDFVSQRQQPRLCLVRPELVEPGLRLRAPGCSPLDLPRSLESGQLLCCRVWDDQCHGLCHAEGSRWFSSFLGEQVALVYMPDSERRAVNPKRARPSDIVSFADGYPCLLVSEASLADLNARLPSPLGMNRFRPNLVLSGCEPYGEDALTTLRIGEVSFRAVKRCERCVVTTIDPDTGERGREPLRALSSYRLEAGKVWFGMNLIPDRLGTLHVGEAAHATP